MSCNKAVVLWARTVHFGLDDPYAHAWWAVNFNNATNGLKKEVFQYSEERGFSMHTIIL